MRPNTPSFAALLLATPHLINQVVGQVKYRNDTTFAAAFPKPQTTHLVVYTTPHAIESSTTSDPLPDSIPVMPISTPSISAQTFLATPPITSGEDELILSDSTSELLPASATAEAYSGTNGTSDRLRFMNGTVFTEIDLRSLGIPSSNGHANASTHDAVSPVPSSALNSSVVNQIGLFNASSGVVDLNAGYNRSSPQYIDLVLVNATSSSHGNYHGQANDSIYGPDTLSRTLNGSSNVQTNLFNASCGITEPKQEYNRSSSNTTNLATSNTTALNLHEAEAYRSQSNMSVNAPLLAFSVLNGSVNVHIGLFNASNSMTELQDEYNKTSPLNLGLILFNGTAPSCYETEQCRALTNMTWHIPEIVDSPGTMNGSTTFELGLLNASNGAVELNDEYNRSSVKSGLPVVERQRLPSNWTIRPHLDAFNRSLLGFGHDQAEPFLNMTVPIEVYARAIASNDTIATFGSISLLNTSLPDTYLLYSLHGTFDTNFTNDRESFDVETPANGTGILILDPMDLEDLDPEDLGMDDFLFDDIDFNMEDSDFNATFAIWNTTSGVPLDDENIVLDVLDLNATDLDAGNISDHDGRNATSAFDEASDDALGTLIKSSELLNLSDSEALEHLCMNETGAAALELGSEDRRFMEAYCTKAVQELLETSANSTDAITLPITSTKTTEALPSSTASRTRPTMTECIDDTDFFEMTPKNLAESGAMEWYQAFTLESKHGENKKHFEAVGEVRFFGRELLHDDDYDCGLQLGGCTRRPSCKKILRLHNYDADMARKVYFVMKMHHTMNQALKTYYDSLQSTHVNIVDLLQPIAQITAQKPDKAAIDACEWVMSTYQNLWALAKHYYFAPLIKDQFWDNRIFGDKDKKKEPDLGRWPFNKPFLRPWNKKKGAVKMNKFLEPKIKKLLKWYWRDQIADVKAGKWLCDGMGMVNMNLEADKERLRLALNEVSLEQRKHLSQHVQNLNRGAFMDGDEDMPSMMSIIMSDPTWSNQTGILDILTDPFQLEETMTNNMKESMVASNYRKNKCFMKCKYHRHADKLCEGYNEWEFEPKRLHGQPVDAAPFQTGPPRSGKAQMESELRICPEKNRICQVECWSQEDRGWNTPLYSYQQLTSKPLGINLTEAMLKNYRYYRNHGNSNPHDPKLATESATKELLGPEPIPGFWLPVCDSDEGYQQIVDFDKQHHSPLMIWNARFSRNLNKRSFPISCGGYRSDATEEFFEAIGMNGYKADFPHRMNRFFKNYAPRQIATLIRPPLDNFLAMCNIGIQYPQGDTQDVWNGEMDIRREPSQFCVPVEEETRGMSQLEANLYFCAKSKHARELFKHQGPNERILGLRRVKNHMMLCEEWYRQERIRHSRVYTDEEWKAAHDLAGLRSDPEYWKDARGVDKAGMPSKKGNRFFQNNFHDMWHPSWDYPHPVWKATKRLTKVYRPINAHHAPIGKQLYRYWTKERAKARMGREIERGRKKGERLERLERKKNLEEVPPEK